MKRRLLPIAVSAILASFTAVGCSGCSGDNGAGHYTYNTYLSTNPKTWNTHNWESSDESYIPAFCEMGLYDVQLNSSKDGYEIVTEMAAAMPVDVTSSITDEEMTKYGYEGNPDKGFVWEIALNDKAVWEDGKAINADTYVESMKRQLDPKMVNFRADSYYASGFVIKNAERYFKQGRTTHEPAFNYLDDHFQVKAEYADYFAKDGFWYLNLSKATPYAATIFADGDGLGFYEVINNRSSSAADKVELAGQRINDAANYFAWKYCNHAGEYEKKWEEVVELKDLHTVSKEMLNYDMDLDDFDNKAVYVRKVKDVAIHTEEEGELYSQEKLKADIRTFVEGMPKSFTGSDAWRIPLFSTYYNDYKEDFGNVGIAKVSDYKFKLFLDQAVTELDLKFSLSSSWIVDVELYDSLKVTTSAGLVSTKYATPGGGLAGYKSYGPYKLTKYEDGKSFLMEKNDKWYGYTDGKHEGQFQMTGLYTRIITDHNTALQEFEKGNLDDFDLNRTDMKTYGNSSRLTQTYESYTQKISFNSDRNTLLSRQSSIGANLNKTILANKNFREGLSLAMDRNLFASQTTAGSKGFTGLLNDLYLTDVEKGEMYRNTAAGKSVYQAVYGQLGGDPYSEGYAPSALDEKSQGYNLNMAVKFIADAFAEEFASAEPGHLVDGNEIHLDFKVYDNESETTIDMLNFIEASFREVISRANQKLGSNVSIDIESIKDEDYYNSAAKGDYDLIFSTWGGAAINPGGLMQVYCDKDFTSCCEFGFKGKQDKIFLDIDSDGDGTPESKTFHAWYLDLNEIVLDKDAEDYELRHTRYCNILAGLEAGILNRFEAVPLIARASSSINSFKIENGSPTYINLIGYGGVRHMTFNYDDAEWAKFVEEHPNLADLYKN